MKKAIVIFLILFFIPFFWLKPGEMDLGGDTSRLYFYDPISYLFGQSLYGIVSSGVGGEAVSYWAIPHLLFFILLKKILSSSTLLISFFNGINLSVAFISIYLIVNELAKAKERFFKKSIIENAALLAALFYVFSPFLIFGWDRTILTRSQLFLNPFIFLFLLWFLKTKNFTYFIVILLITFIFSPNFTYVAAPPFFAFYPLSIGFLFIYIKFIRKEIFPFKSLFIGLLLFFLLQSFHLIPQLISLFSPGSDVNASVFSEKAKLSRGLDYFIAIAPSVKVSFGFLNLPQLTKLDYTSFLFIIFPFVLLFGSFLNSNLHRKPMSESILIHKRIFLLTGLFFLVTVYFYTASITDIGFNFYKALFHFPGFSMFRNFYGQWGFVYIFFYSLLFGQALIFVFAKSRKNTSLLLAFFIVTLLIYHARGFINGSFISLELFQTKIKPVIQMDPKYEQALNYVRLLPVDGKIFSFPITDPGYQVISGENGGAYVGPSTFSYLAGKNDFTGYEGLYPFSQLFFTALLNKDSQTLGNLFSILNIRYIYYNSDPKVLDNSFPGFPYGLVREYFPETQEEYKKFIKSLPFQKVKSINDTFHFYLLNNSLYIPHIYSTNRIIQSTNPKNTLSDINISSTPSAVIGMGTQVENADDFLVEAIDTNPFIALLNNYHLHKHAPFVSVKTDDVFYPLILLREKFDLWRVKNKHDRYVDLSLLLSAKRIAEIKEGGENTLVLRSNWKELKPWDFGNLKKNRSWEAGLFRYKIYTEDFIRWVEKSNESDSWKKINKIKINEAINQHQIGLNFAIKSNVRKAEDRKYLRILTNKIFEDIEKKLSIGVYDPSTINYYLDNADSGKYQVYLYNKNRQKFDSNLIEIQGKRLYPLKTDSNSGIIQFDNVTIDNTKRKHFIFKSQPENLATDSIWQNSGFIKETEYSFELNLKNISGNYSGFYSKETGLVKEIFDWKPERQYVITFDYKTFGDDVIFKIFEKIKTKGEEKLKENIFAEKNLNSPDWKFHQSIITSDAKSAKGFLQISTTSDKEINKVLIKNLKIVEMPYPRIVFKKIVEKKNLVSPKIIFTKINPTKYRVDVSGAKDPYALVFLEAFNKNWKVILIDEEEKGFENELNRVAGNAFKFFIAIFIKDGIDGNKINENYFNGIVSEGMHKNVFLAPDTFETWGKKTIADNMHFTTNAYANGWYIKPEDVNEKQKYSLAIEFAPQRTFYIFLILSFFTFVSLFLLLVYKIKSIRK